MKKLTFLFITLITLSFNAFADNNADVIVGEWHTENHEGKVTIYKQGDMYYGKISGGKTPGRKDSNNPDPSARNKELIGTVILKNFKFTGKSWEKGTIYDPNSGKTYDCILKIKDNNKTLDIRGYIGISMFGRTSTWTRS
ncbi:DUF2147 domain-containing protein [Aquirufa sp. ROCK2-A2]